MNQCQTIPISDVLLVLLRSCEQYLESDKEVEAKATYDNAITLAMVYGYSDDVVRRLFAVARKLSGVHNRLHYFATRATALELAQLQNHQNGFLDAVRVIEKASRPDVTIPPLLS